MNRLTSVEREAAARAIADARDKGDLSENAEYEAAKDAQGLLEMKIAQLQNLIINARVIDESLLNTEVIQIMNKVRIRNVDNKSIMEVTLVGESEANLAEKTGSFFSHRKRLAREEERRNCTGGNSFRYGGF